MSRSVEWDAKRHEWVSFIDADGDTWLFDVTFLTSNWTCIFGQGCLGVHDTPTPELGHGCCSFGAHFQDDEDVARVKKYLKRLTPDTWQHHDKAKKLGGPIYTNRAGETVTRVHNGACIMLNRNDFHRGGGCALHTAALDAGERPLDWKPGVCWQLPLRLEQSEDDKGRSTYTLKQWDRSDWGGGGDDFHWWCVDDDLAFRDRSPVYLTLRDEIVEMVGQDAYDWIAAYIDRRGLEVALPHPARAVKHRSASRKR